MHRNYDDYDDYIDNAIASIGQYGGYRSKFGNDIASTYNTLSNWNYDPQTDAAYKAYEQLYTDKGRKAMQDTLGEVSARTGGLASSYAENAAQGSYNDYMERLAQMIPTLEQNAYNRAYNRLSMLLDLDNMDYTRWYNSEDEEVGGSGGSGGGGGGRGGSGKGGSNDYGSTNYTSGSIVNYLADSSVPLSQSNKVQSLLDSGVSRAEVTDAKKYVAKDKQVANRM